MPLCVEGSHRCIVACIHLGNGTGRRTVTIAAPLLLSSGPVLHRGGTSPVGVGSWY